MSMVFPKGFLWGAAASAPQLEGAAFEDGRRQTVWDYWYNREPQRFHEQVGPAECANFYTQYAADVLRMKDLGFNSFRTSIAWARLMPDGKNVNPLAVSFYRDVFSKLLQHNITPIVNLYHFDMPMLFHEIGGWENRDTVNAFVEYAKAAYEYFGDLVENWVTFNEPIVPIEMGYMNQHHLPGICDMRRAAQAGFNTMLAHKGAVKAFRASETKGRVGIIINLTPTYPKSDDPEDVYAAQLADVFFNRSFLDPAVKGTYPEPLIQIFKQEGIYIHITDEDRVLIQDNNIDFLGVNYYQPRRVQKGNGYSDFTMGFEKYFKPYRWVEAKMNPHRGWEIYEKGLYDIAINIKENYDNMPWYVAENGIGVEGEDQFIVDGIVVDDYRISFMKNHLKWLHQGISEGSNCFGYHTWTYVDNWSWLNGFKNRYGLYRLNVETQERTPKRSGAWFKSVAIWNRLPEED